MKLIETPIQGSIIVENNVYVDNRGQFFELFKTSAYSQLNLPSTYIQDNISVSHKNVLRGLHLQKVQPQGKLVTCLTGKIYDVCVDLRPNSPSFMRWYGVELAGGSGRSFYLPPGCAHGFLSLEDNSTINYKCTTEYDKFSDGGVRWDDSQLNIQWPGDGNYIISDKDKTLPFVGEYLGLCGAV